MFQLLHWVFIIKRFQMLEIRIIAVYLEQAKYNRKTEALSMEVAFNYHQLNNHLLLTKRWQSKRFQMLELIITKIWRFKNWGIFHKLPSLHLKNSKRKRMTKTTLLKLFNQKINTLISLSKSLHLQTIQTIKIQNNSFNKDK